MVAVSSVKVGVYNLAVPILHVQFKGGKQATQITFAKIEDDGKTLILKNDAGEKIGSINQSGIEGWWIGPDLPDTSAAF